jgi:hypothetical protein
VDIILSHKLYNNLHLADTLKSISEIARVLTVGGEARLSDISDLAFKYIDKFLQQNYSKELVWKYKGLLVIMEKRQTIKNEVPMIPFDSRFRYQGIPNGTRTFELPWAEGETPDHEP